MEKILAFQVKDKELEKLKQIVGSMKIKLQVTEKSDFCQRIGDLLEQKKNPLLGSYEGEAVTESMIVLEDFSDKKLDALLRALKRDGVSIAFKAVATPTNRKWTVLQLYFEMEKERKAYLDLTSFQRSL